MNTISIIKKRFFESKIFLIGSIIASALIGAIIIEIIISQTVMAQTLLSKELAVKSEALTKKPEVAKKIKMVVTAYSSTPEQTDNTPFVTASGKKVADGVVANNMLPFNSKIRMPELYGDKVFVVEDRMHQRKGKYHVDIWFPEYKEAKNFGAKITSIEVLKD